MTEQQSFRRAAIHCFYDFIRAAFRYYEPTKIVVDSPLLVRVLGLLADEITHTDDCLFGCRIRRWITAQGELIQPLDPNIPKEFNMTGKNTITESSFPQELLGLSTAISLLQCPLPLK